MGWVEFVQELGVQEISSIAGKAGEIFKRLACKAAYERISHQGMAAYGCQMDSDLMRAARIGLTSNVVVLVVREITLCQ